MPEDACALLNNHLSGQSDVLFTNTQAGWQWPFMDDAIVKHLPNPISIAGSTLAAVVNRIHIEPREKVSVFLQSLETEQRHLTVHWLRPLCRALCFQPRSFSFLLAMLASTRQPSSSPRPLS